MFGAAIKVIFTVTSSLLLVSLLLPSATCKYSSKTAYLDRFTDSQLKFINDPNNYRIAGCRPEQIYLFLRHGARSPSAGQVIKSKSFLEDYRQFKKRKVERGLIDESTRSVLDDVEASFADGPFYTLTDLGVHEMKSIASRFRQRYPSLFDPVDIGANLDLVDVLSSNKSRSIDSAHSFLRGLYDDERNGKLADELIARTRFNNTIMRLFDECDRYTQGVKNNMSAGVELTRFENGPEMSKLIDEFIERNSLHGMEFKTSIVRKLFTLCTIEMAHRMKDNWCKVFAKDDYEVLAYHNDLKSYWLKSYGHEVNSKVSLLIYKELVENMQNFIRNLTSKEPVNRRVLLRFGHAENIIPMVSVLDLFRDANELRADNFAQNLNRKFRTGEFSPFSANMAFVLHRCPLDVESSNENGGGGGQYKIHVLLNELPVKVIEGDELSCVKMNKASRVDDGSLCELRNFRAQIQRFVDEDFSQACSSTNNDSKQQQHVPLGKFEFLDRRR